jgi:hypothetical protein
MLSFLVLIVSGFEEKTICYDRCMTMTIALVKSKARLKSTRRIGEAGRGGDALG